MPMLTFSVNKVLVSDMNTTRLFTLIDLHLVMVLKIINRLVFFQFWLLCIGGISWKDAVCYLLFVFGGVKRKKADAWIDFRIICGCLTRRFINVQLHAQNVSKYMEPHAAHITNERNKFKA